MKRAWIAVALLAVSWLFGLDYFHPANWTVWVLAVAAGCLLLGGALERMPSRRDMTAALAMLLPVAWFLPWPYRAAPLLMALGLGVELAPLATRWPRWLGRGAMAAGVVLLVQSIALWAYTLHTARNHELPWPLPWLIGQVAALAGADAAVDGSAVALRIRGQVHSLGATWELLFDPATLGFLAGGIALLGLVAWGDRRRENRWADFVRAIRTLAIVVAAWLPFRVGVLIALYMHRALRTEEIHPRVMDQFFSPWVLGIALAGPLLLAICFLRREATGETESDRGEESPAAAGWSLPLAACLGLVALGVALATVTFQRDPAGRRAEGRVMFVERHSLWEPTTKPYDTDPAHYGEMGSYNYAAIYDYCGQYFDVSRLAESDAIDDETLARCDVLVVKTPTARYAPQEVEAIGRFVAGGGGLLLVGDHTNVFRTSTYLNDIARQFGFTYRDDLLFCVGSPYEQQYRHARVPHPAVQYVPSMDFAVSCSIDPGTSFGEPVIRSTGLWSLPAQYDFSNYHPLAEYRPDMRYGAFIQVWATRSGGGRVLAFTDSTIFSNFCTFQPGKAELMIGMLDWLNYRDLVPDRLLRVLLMLVALASATAALVAGLWIGRGARPSWIAVLASAMLGLVLGSMFTMAAQRSQVPRPRPVRPMTRVVIDRTTSEVPLANGAFSKSEAGYGMLERWIARLGCYTIREEGDAAFSGDVMVAICPTRSVTPEFRQRLVQYVDGGGRLLVIDSPEMADSTANSLLWPFGMAVSHTNTNRSGDLVLGDGRISIPVSNLCEVTGGEPIARVGDVPVAAVAHYGKGTVVAVGVGSLFHNIRMGTNWSEGAPWMTDPTPELLQRYEVLYSILRIVLPKRSSGAGGSAE